MGFRVERRSWALQLGASLATAITGAGLLLVPGTAGVAAVAGMGLLMIALLVPLSWVVAAFGMLLPIWSMSTLSPVLFDIARVLTAAVILVRFTPSLRQPGWNKSIKRWVLPLGIAGAAMTVFGLVNSDSSSVGIGWHILIALPVSLTVISRMRNPWPLLLGYLGGSTLSATVLVLTSLGIPTVSPQLNPGFDRVTGLAPSAPLASYQLAMAVTIGAALVTTATKARLVPALATLLCATALLLSGGRGGLVGLTIAIMVALRWRWIRARFAVLAAGMVSSALLLAAYFSLSLNTLSRFENYRTSGTDLTTGRLTLLREALSWIGQQPLLGAGLDAFTSAYGLSPHMAPLTFAVGGGVVAGATIVLLTLQIVGLLLFHPPARSSDGRAGYLILSVQVSWLVIEPNGPFVGVEGISLMLTSIFLTYSALASDGQGEPESRQHRTRVTRYRGAGNAVPDPGLRI